MDPKSSKNESDVSPRAISLSLSGSNKVKFPLRVIEKMGDCEYIITKLKKETVFLSGSITRCCCSLETTLAVFKVNLMA